MRLLGIVWLASIGLAVAFGVIVVIRRVSQIYYFYCDIALQASVARTVHLAHSTGAE